MYIRKLYQQIDFYDIIEIEQVQQHFQDNLASKGIRYVELNTKNEYDLVYSNSCIQYFPDISPLLQCISNTSPKFVLLDDIYLSQKSQFFCHQKYYEDTMVMSFISYNELIQSMLDINYTICFSGIYRDPILEDKEFPLIVQCLNIGDLKKDILLYLKIILKLII